jgi:hypothetical protein
VTNAPPEAELEIGGCAQDIVILGFYTKNPLTYPGIYGFGGDIFAWPQQTTVFKGWDVCS